MSEMRYAYTNFLIVTCYCMGRNVSVVPSLILRTKLGVSPLQEL